MTDNQNNTTMPKLDVSVRLTEPSNNLRGFADVTFNDAFVVRGFSIRQGQNGLYVGMPSRPDEKAKSGYRETAHPITAEFRTQLNDAIFDAYSLQVARVQEQAKAHGNIDYKPRLAEQLANGQAKAAEHNAKTATKPPQEIAAPAV